MIFGYPEGYRLLHEADGPYLLGVYIRNGLVVGLCTVVIKE